MNKKCVSCGMPMARPEDFALADTSKDYCLHCARPSGEMKSYDEVLAAMAGWMVKTQGIDEDIAKSMAKNTMTKLPAWKKQGVA